MDDSGVESPNRDESGRDSSGGVVLDGRDRFPKKKPKVSIVDGRVVDVVEKARADAWAAARTRHLPDLEKLRQKNKEKENERTNQTSDGSGLRSIGPGRRNPRNPASDPRPARGTSNRGVLLPFRSTKKPGDPS